MPKCRLGVEVNGVILPREEARNVASMYPARMEIRDTVYDICARLWTLRDEYPCDHNIINDPASLVLRIHERW